VRELKGGLQYLCNDLEGAFAERPSRRGPLGRKGNFFEGKKKKKKNCDFAVENSAIAV